MKYKPHYLIVCSDTVLVLSLSRLKRRSSRIPNIVGGHYRIVCICQCSLSHLMARRWNLALPELWARPEAPQSSPSHRLPLEPVQRAPALLQLKTLPKLKTLPPLAFSEMSKRESPKEKAKRLKVTNAYKIGV